MIANALDLDWRYAEDVRRQDLEKRAVVEDRIRACLARGIPAWAIVVVSFERSFAPMEYSVHVERHGLAYASLASRVRRDAHLSDAYRFFRKFVTRIRPT